jgi:hypothetical protein
MRADISALANQNDCRATIGRSRSLRTDSPLQAGKPVMARFFQGRKK